MAKKMPVKGKSKGKGLDVVIAVAPSGKNPFKSGKKAAKGGGVCPECGGKMKNGKCPDCGYMAK